MEIKTSDEVTLLKHLDAIADECKDKAKEQRFAGETLWHKPPNKECFHCIFENDDILLEVTIFYKIHYQWCEIEYQRWGYLINEGEADKVDFFYVCVGNHTADISQEVRNYALQYIFDRLPESL